MLYENWWPISYPRKKLISCPNLSKNITTDCVVVGGGFAGLHAALRLIESGRKVVLLEKSVCGGSSSGQSGGFLTPESEEDLAGLMKKYGKDKAQEIYDIPLKGLNLILSTIKKYNLKCDFRKQDSIYLSVKKTHNKDIEGEAETRKSMDLPFKLLDEKQLGSVHPGKGYIRGMLYPGSYGINSFAYCQELKNLLIRKGVTVYEDTEVIFLDGTKVKTLFGSVDAKNVLICIDKMKSELNKELSKHCYHIQTHVAVSEPISSNLIKSIFPKKELMCWDSRLKYSYYRMIQGNRLLLGGSRYMTMYSSKLVRSSKVMESIIQELKDNFSSLNDVKFTHYWSGLIDVTRDLTPIADYDSKNNSIQYCMGCAGLPWAAFCGDYIARRVINPKKTEDLSQFLGINRKHFLPLGLKNVLGKKILFGLSHLKQMFS